MSKFAMIFTLVVIIYSAGLHLSDGAITPQESKAIVETLFQSMVNNLGDTTSGDAAMGLNNGFAKKTYKNTDDMWKAAAKAFDGLLNYSSLYNKTDLGRALVAFEQSYANAGVDVYPLKDKVKALKAQLRLPEVNGPRYV